MKYLPDMLYIPQLEDEPVYHYTSLSSFLSIVGNHEYWVTHSGYMNDRDELCVGIDIFSYVCEEEGIDSSITEAATKFAKEVLQNEELGYEYYIFSCSLDSDSQLLWTNYANGDGINIKIDYSKLVCSFEQSKYMFWSGVVIYDEEKQKKCIKEALYNELDSVVAFGETARLSDLNHISGDEKEMAILHMGVICFLYSLFFKRGCFSNEQEFRVVFSPVDSTVKQFRIARNTILPYLKVDSVNNDYISVVKIGPTNNSEVSMRGIKSFLKSSGSDAEVNHSDIPLRF